MFFNHAGKMALGSRLRMLSEKVTEDAVNIYKLYDVGLKPKWFPVFYVISECNIQSVMAIADEIGHSHPSVVTIVREMVKDGILEERKDSSDKRKSIIELTAKGEILANNIREQYIDVRNAVDEALQQTRHDLWQAMEEFEFQLAQKSLLVRVREQKKIREAQKVKLVDYEPKYFEAFKRLNEQWITQYFKMEEADHKALDNPQTGIIDKGGFILVALYEEEPIGVCAMIKMEDPDYDFELAKMAVAPEAHGKGIGWVVGKGVIDKARSLGAKRIYLESNTILEPAINLYHKLGFKKVAGHTTPYERCNIQMELQMD